MQSRLAGVLLSLFVLGCAASVLGACNTTAGLGQDVSATGKRTETAADSFLCQLGANDGGDVAFVVGIESRADHMSGVGDHHRGAQRLEQCEVYIQAVASSADLFARGCDRLPIDRPKWAEAARNVLDQIRGAPEITKQQTQLRLCSQRPIALRALSVRR